MPPTLSCTAIVDRLDAYVAMLLGGAGLFAASEDITREDFADYVERLEVGKRYPGVRGIGFSRRIGPDERQSVLDFVRRDLPDFRFWPEPPEGDINAILYLEPDDEMNRRALGYDMGSETNRAEAMARARDSGAPAASGKVRLVQEGGDNPDPQAGFLIYVPVYRDGTVPGSEEQRRRALVGYVYSPFRADDLLRKIVDSHEPSVVGFEVFDGAVSEASLMHRSEPAIVDRRFQLERTLDDRGPPVDGPPVRGRLDA